MNFPESEILVPLVRKGDAPPLFLVPASGATPFSVVRLARSVNIGAPIYAFSEPSLEFQRDAFATIEDAAQCYLEQVRRVQPNGPYRFCGHCGGSAIALDMAARLEAEDQEVSALIFLEAFPPPLTDDLARERLGTEDQHTERDALLDTYVRCLLDKAAAKLDLLPEDMAAHLGRNSALQMSATRDYRARPVSGPIHIVRSGSVPEHVFEVWKHIGAGGVEFHVVPGDSESMLEPPNVSVLGSCVAGILK